jgi:hypothetical protein
LGWVGLDWTRKLGRLGRKTRQAGKLVELGGRARWKGRLGW